MMLYIFLESRNLIHFSINDFRYLYRFAFDICIFFSFCFKSIFFLCKQVKTCLYFVMSHESSRIYNISFLSFLAAG